MLLDTGPLGLASNSRQTPETAACRTWLDGLLDARIRIIIPEIADYEVRREEVRAGKVKGLANLNDMALLYDFLPVSPHAWRQAAQFWAQSRQQGQPTAGNRELDGDVILAAQAATLLLSADQVVVATGNEGHIGRFVTAQAWQDISPPLSPE